MHTGPSPRPTLPPAGEYAKAGPSLAQGRPYSHHLYQGAQSNSGALALWRLVARR
jgi:hypothetical protein